MADALDLTHQDYRNFVQHSRECKSSFEIKTYIDKKLSKYHADNEDIIQCLMEKVEELKLKDFNYENGFIDDFCDYDYLNFEEECPGEKYPQLRYLYSYICYLSDHDDEYKKVISLNVKSKDKRQVEQHKRQIAKLINFGFKKEHKDKIEKIAQELTKDKDIKFLKEIEMAKTFADVLTANDLNEIDRNCHVKFQCSNSVVLYILNKYAISFETDLIIQRLVDCPIFINKGGKRLVPNDLSKAKKRMKRLLAAVEEGRVDIKGDIDSIFLRYNKKKN